jgi:hypothetical protein
MPRRASDIIQPMSPQLEEIRGQEVVVKGVSIQQRAMRGADNTFVEVTLDDNRTFHAWSAPLAERLAQFTDADLQEGVICIFDKEKTTSGFMVWVVS